MKMTLWLLVGLVAVAALAFRMNLHLASSFTTPLMDSGVPQWTTLRYATSNTSCDAPRDVWVDHPQSRTWWPGLWSYWCPWFATHVTYVRANSTFLLHQEPGAPALVVPPTRPGVNVRVTREPYRHSNCYSSERVSLGVVLPLTIYSANIFHMMHENLLVTMWTLLQLGFDWERDLPIEQLFYFGEPPYHVKHGKVPIANLLLANEIRSIEDMPQERICFDQVLVGNDYTGFLDFWYNHERQYGVFLRRFRDLLWQRNGIVPAASSNRIVVIRRDDRPVHGMAEALEALQPEFPQWHLHHARLEELSWTQQFQLMADSVALVGLHAAGLSHAPWLRNSGVIVEIVRWSYDRPGIRFFDGMRAHMRARSDLGYRVWVLDQDSSVCRGVPPDCERGADPACFDSNHTYRSYWFTHVGYSVSVPHVRRLLRATVDLVRAQRAQAALGRSLNESAV